MVSTEKHTYTYLCEKRALRKRYQIIAALQATLSVAAFGFSLLPWCDEIAYSWFAPPLPWLTRTSSMWAAAVALCLLWGRFGDTLWLSTAYDLQLIVALVSATCFLLLGWNVVSIDSACSSEPAALHVMRSHPHSHALGRAAAHGHRAEAYAASRDANAAISAGEHAANAPPAFLHKMAMAIVGKQDAPVACEPFPTRIAVATFYGMGIAMSLQVGVCICAAFAVRSAKLKRRLELSTGSLPTTQPPPPALQVAKLPRGWREHVDPQSGRCFYEHIRTKKIQWELPKGNGRREAASDAEDGRSGCYSDSNYRTS